jgi:prepilin-type N-terminal cleavage/methylation domain-containing protein
MMKRMPANYVKRPAFTVMELLVVIAIIAILVGMVLVAVMPSLDTQKRRNTEKLLGKLRNPVTQQWKAVVDSATAVDPPQAVVDFANGDRQVAKAIWIKLNLKCEFPMSYSEALNPMFGFPASIQNVPQLQARDHFKKALQGRIAAAAASAQTIVTAIDLESESAALLLIALQQGRRGMKFNAEEGLGASAIKDTDGDGLPEIVDGWGKAVGFCRWGVGNPDLLALASSNSSSEMEAALKSGNWNFAGNSNVATFELYCHLVHDPSQPMWTPQPYTTIPTVVSAGKDGRFGLDWWMTYQGPDADDNLYSFKVK